MLEMALIMEAGFFLHRDIHLIMFRTGQKLMVL